MAYTPPNGTAADFELLAYTPPSGTNADFDFSTTTASDILSELTGYENISGEILSEVTGAATSSDILSEVFGELNIAGQILSELQGSGTTSDILSELIGYEVSNSDILSEIYGIYDKPSRLGYRIIIKDANGDIVGEVDTYRKVTCSKRLNNYGQAEFDIRVDDPKASDLISLRSNSIEIYRQSGLTSTLIWAGEQSLCRGELNESGNNWATVFGFTWFEQLLHRYTPASVTYTAEDQGAIAQDLIETTNTDDPTKITIGTVTATVDRDRTYYSDNIGEMIINLANVNDGFDFEVTDLGAFNADSILGTDKTDAVVFKYGHNIKNMSIIEDFTNPINRAIVLGEATGETTLQRVERDDAGSQTAYGLREGRLQEMNISGLSTLQDKGDAALRKYGLPLIKVEFDLIKNITPSIDQFGVGDGIRLIAQAGMYDIDEQYRVFEWELEFDNKDNEKLTLTLGKFITI